MTLLPLWNNTFALILVLMTVVLAAACAVASRFRWSAVTKNSILLPALVVASVLPMTLIATRSSEWSVPVPVLKTPAVSRPLEPPQPVTEPPRAVSSPVESAGTPSSQRTEHASATSAPVIARTARSLVPPLLLVWAAGSIVCLVRLGRSYLSLWRLLANAYPVTDPRVLETAEHARSSLGLSRYPTVLVTDRVSSPVAVGTPHHGWVIWPPDTLELMPREQLNHVLVHEGAHIAHRDTSLRLIQGLIAALWWWHPLVHLLNRQLSRTREELCDNAVISSADPVHYGQTLLEIGRPSTLAPALAVTLFPEHEKLELRIRSLLNPRRSTMHRSKPIVLVLACFTGLGASAFAGATQVTAIPPADPIKPPESLWLTHDDRTLVEEYTLTLEDDETPGHLDIDIKAGDILVTAYGGDEILVRLSVPNKKDDEDDESADGFRTISSIPLDFEVRQDENFIELDANTYEQITHVEVLVPRRIDLTLDSYLAGVIRVSGVVGHIGARSQNNNIILDDISGSADVYGYNGSFKADFRDVTGDLAFETYNGSIGLRLPRDLQATAYLRTEREEVRSQFEIVTRSANATESRRTDGTLSIDFDEYVIGDINGGGAPVVIETTNGSVVLRKN